LTVLSTSISIGQYQQNGHFYYSDNGNIVNVQSGVLEKVVFIEIRKLLRRDSRSFFSSCSYCLLDEATGNDIAHIFIQNLARVGPFIKVFRSSKNLYKIL
jgi:hypothetical protein